jgi:NADPH:quinone reductase
MHAWLCEQTIGPAGLRWAVVDTPTPLPGEVRVAVRCASLNFPDSLIIENRYQFKPPLPFIPGCEFSGVVDAVGADVHHLRMGDRVAAFGGVGAFAEQVCIDARQVLPLGDAFSFESAAAFICTYGTTHHALIDRAALQAGEVVLVLGAAGGVGSAAVQVAKAAGARVIAAASTDEKCESCRALGADEVIQTQRENLRERLRALTGGAGPDVIYDPVGGPQTEAAFRSIAWRGRHLVIGFAQGDVPALPLNLTLLKGASVVGVFWGDFARREPAASAAALQTLSQWFAAGRINPLIDDVLPMIELPAAFERMGRRQVCGKLVLRNAT